MKELAKGTKLPEVVQTLNKIMYELNGLERRLAGCEIMMNDLNDTIGQILIMAGAEVEDPRFDS